MYFFTTDYLHPSTSTILLDEKNAFNELNCQSMLWHVWHLWPLGASFVLNCYKHWSTLLLRMPDSSDTFTIHSKEGVTQGDPLSMYCYGIGVMPLIERTVALFPTLFQPWYADDSVAGGRFSVIEDLLEFLRLHGPGYGYYPEPKKSVLLVHKHNLAAAQERFQNVLGEIRLGGRYLGSYLGNDDAGKDNYIGEKVEAWQRGIEALAGAAKSYPQSAYHGLQLCLQAEWKYIQRVTPGVAEKLANIQTTLHSTFIPALFDEAPLEPDDH